MRFEDDQFVQSHLQNLRQLQTESGLFLASAQDVPTGYDKAWLRDNFYASLAFEELEEWDTVYKLWRAILTIFSKHEFKIDWAVKEKPHESWQYIHARYNPETFEEFWEEWGNKQNDAIGAILFKLAELRQQGHPIVESDDEHRIVQKLIDYICAVEYWHDPDNGIWEEFEEVHASSIAPVVAGLKKLQELGDYRIPEGAIERGEEALQEMLPRESPLKFADLALLSLIYPYQVIDRDMEDAICENITYHLERKHGIIRYKNDAYYNKNEDGFSEEAEWTFGFPWLAIIYHQRGQHEKAEEYFEKACNTLVDGEMPELYYSNSDMPNENVPLGWSESLLLVAYAKLNS